MATQDKDRKLITADELRALVDYNPETGEFFRKTAAGGYPTGSRMGRVGNRGYLRIGVAGRCYLAHRLAWMYVHATWPAAGLDHRDGDPLNNRLANLREATQAANNQNRAKQRSPTTSRFLGVDYRKATGLWRARIKLAGEHYYLGAFPTQEEAYAAYLRAKAVLHTFNPAVRDVADGR